MPINHSVTEELTNKQILLKKIQSKAARIAVVGLGYVGLPFLVEKAKVGLNVIALDRNEARIEKIRKGESYIDDVKDEDLKNIVDKGLVTASTDPSVLNTADVIVICVPTPLDKNLCPDLSFVRSVAKDIADHIRPGQLISLESTTYPGTTEEVIKPILEGSGLKAGKEIFIVHSPERVDPGNKRYTTHNTNKVVGGVNEASIEVAVAFYKLAIEHVVPVSSATIAEMVKVFENTYRAVNIALVNEMALLCDRMDVDVWEMLDAAFTKPFGIMPFYPGPGVGGHCIPIDPHYLEWKAKEYNFNTRFIGLAGEINRRMPLFVFNKITRVLNDEKKAMNGAKVLVLGVAYKSDLHDYRESPAMDVLEKLIQGGADISYHDTFAPNIQVAGTELSSVGLTEELIKESDMIVLTTKHSNVDYNFVLKHANKILDTRGVYREKNDRVVLL